MSTHRTYHLNHTLSTFSHLHSQFSLCREHILHTILITVSFLFFLQLFDLVYREETLLNVIKSVTRNGRSIVLTAVLALILVYLFSIVGYIFFKDDFILAVDRIPNKTLGTLKYRFALLHPDSSKTDTEIHTHKICENKCMCFYDCAYLSFSIINNMCT